MPHAKSSNLVGYLGTYASPVSKGIYRFTLDTETGVLTMPQLYFEAPDAKSLSLSDGLLAAPVQGAKKAGVCLLDTRTAGAPRLAGEAYEETKTACFVIQHGGYLCTANYHEGLLLIYKKSGRPFSDSGGGLTLQKRIFIAPRAGCHQILFHGHYLLAPCLLLDKILIFDRDKDFFLSGEIRFPSGTGPRHAVFTGDGKKLFVISEKSNELFLFRADDALNFHLLASCPLFSPKGAAQEQAKGAAREQAKGAAQEQAKGAAREQAKDAAQEQAGASAAVRLSPDERFIYVSTRFSDVLTVFDVQDGRPRIIQQTESGGRHPRDILLAGNGRFLLAANRTGGGLVCFRLNRETGRIGPECSRVPAPEAVAIALDE